MKIPLITISAIMLLGSCQGDSKKETTAGSSGTLPVSVESKKSDQGAEAIITSFIAKQGSQEKEFLVKWIDRVRASLN